MDELTQLDEHLFDVARDIEEHGYHITSVLPERSGPGYAYTVGWSLRSQPELVTVGAEPARFHSMFWSLAQLRQRGCPVTSETEAIFEDDYGHFCVLAVPATYWKGPDSPMLGIHSYLQAVGQLSALRSGVLQVVWADSRGRFPWEPDVDPEVALRQPVLASGEALDWPAA